MAPPEGSAPPAAAPGLFAQLSGLLRELPGLLNDRIDLFVLELQRASHALAQVVVIVLFTAIVAATAWLAFWCGVVALLVGSLGWSLPLALLATLLVNLLAAGLAVRRLGRLLPLLSLPATRRHLSFGPLREPASDPPVAADPAPDDAHRP